MARKRGGLAGLYDRNKGVIRMLAPAVVGAIPGLGPLAAAGLGAAMRGLDREGKSGIGFDVKQGIRGGLEGYGMGKLGQGARTGIAKMFAPKMPTGALNMDVINADIARGLGETAAPSIAMPTGGISMPSITAPAAASSFVEAPARSISASAPSGAARASAPSAARSITSAPTPSGASGSIGAAQKAMEKAPGKITQGLDYLAKYEKPLAMLTKGVMSGIPSEEDALNSEATRQTMRLNQQRFDEEMRRQRLQEERMANMTQLLIPLLRQQMTQPQPRTLAEYLQGR